MYMRMCQLYVPTYLLTYNLVILLGNLYFIKYCQQDPFAYKGLICYFQYSVCIDGCMDACVFIGFYLASILILIQSGMGGVHTGYGRGCVGKKNPVGAHTR